MKQDLLGRFSLVAVVSVVEIPFRSVFEPFLICFFEHFWKLFQTQTTF
jgi:hypothetical protein